MSGATHELEEGSHECSWCFRQCESAEHLEIHMVVRHKRTPGLLLPMIQDVSKTAEGTRE